METGAIQLVVTACGCDTAYAKTLLLMGNNDPQAAISIYKNVALNSLFVQTTHPSLPSPTVSSSTKPPPIVLPPSAGNDPRSNLPKSSNSSNAQVPTLVLRPGPDPTDAIGVSIGKFSTLGSKGLGVGGLDVQIPETGKFKGKVGDLDIDGDNRLVLLYMIVSLGEEIQEKESLWKELEQKADELENTKKIKQEVETDLDQMRSSHQDEKRRLEEAYKKLTKELRELHEQRSILQQSHEDERISLQATFKKEKESLQNIIQEKADVLEKLQTAELARTTAVKDHGALLDRIREVAKRAQCQISETAPDPQPVKKKGWRERRAEKRQSKLGAPSASSTNKAVTLESLDADALVQKLTKRIDQLLAAESNNGEH